MFLTNKRIAAVLNFFGYFVLIAGLIGAFIAAGTVSELGGATIPTFLGVACASVLSSFVLIALSRILKMLTSMWTSD